jgi:deazaflavin-dependent oxidoreductase (nitroreductase family)
VGGFATEWMAWMAGKELLAKLKTEKELELTVQGRRTGRNLPRPVWFVLKEDAMLLLPVKGSSTQWYKNIVKNPQVTIRIKGLTHSNITQTITSKKEVLEIVELFKKKYGAGDIKRYYPKINVAARLPLT